MYPGSVLVENNTLFYYVLLTRDTDLFIILIHLYSHCNSPYKYDIQYSDNSEINNVVYNEIKRIIVNLHTSKIT